MIAIRKLISMLWPRKALVGKVNLQRLQEAHDCAGVTAKGKRSVIDDIIDRVGARPGDTVVVEQNGQARVVGRRPELAVDNINVGPAKESNDTI